MSTVLIVEDHWLMAESLALALRAEGFSPVVAPLRSSEEVLAVAAETRPAVVLLDLELPIGSGLGLISPLVNSETRVIIVSGSRSRVDIAAAIEAGAHGFIEKSRPLAQLIEAIRATLAGRQIMSAQQRQALLTDLHASRATLEHELRPFTRLTRREQEVLRDVMEGRRAEDIAKAGSVSEATIRTQLRGILTKLGVRSQLEAVTLAHRVGWPARSSTTD